MLLKIINKSGEYGAQLVSCADFTVGDVVYRVSGGKLSHEASYKTVQIDYGRHIFHKELANLNHSCQPNTRFNTQTLELTAIREIHEGEELTYFYPSTEWQMVRPFKCLCKAENCIGSVEGARFLSMKILANYALSPFVNEMLALRPTGSEFQVEGEMVQL